jgi:hypothetical protein
MTERDYEVGYGRPPRHSRFKPGQSGNPRGAKPGTRSFKAVVAEELQARIKVTEGGRTRTLTKQQAIAKQLVMKAMRGDEKAFAKLAPFIVALDSAEEATAATAGLSDNERRMLKRNAKMLLQALEAEADQ